MRALIGPALLLLAAALPQAPAAAQTDISQPGTVAHAAARTGFPERIGRFRRAAVLRYDEQGLDLSGNYDLVTDRGWIRISVYIYPAPPVAVADRTEACRQVFEVTEAVTLEQEGAIALGSDTAPPAPGLDPAPGFHAAHRMRLNLGGRAQEVRNDIYLYCYVGGDWLVKFLVSATPGMDARPEVESFIRGGPWPGRAMPGDPASPGTIIAS